MSDSNRYLKRFFAMPESTARVALLLIARILIAPGDLVWLTIVVVADLFHLPSLGAPGASLGVSFVTLLGLVPCGVADSFLSRHRAPHAATA